MADEVYLHAPTEALKASYLDFLGDWKQSNEKLVPWVIGRDTTDFSQFLKLFEVDQHPALESEKVPTTTYWYCNQERIVIGAVNIRHYLNDKFRTSGGHIGYGIRPSYRGQGHATKQLKLALEKCKELGIQEALVTCDQGNIGSKKTIIANGGIKDHDFIQEDGSIIERYWIKVL
ncbi:GNAT family N-acetyltransferase [Carnobacterium gallinarum]|uniref:GNAT family N-acetyltransferase n=1 Tax=Carnobacterium gallinarum TaxID=2749 RepID=UPI000557A73F|nr:GNAT family N-acetyltransferase [Carnobacterium gallinarum]